MTAPSLMERALKFVAAEMKTSGSPMQKTIGEHLGSCQVNKCDKFTIGAVCAECSRHVCRSHGFMTLSVPPAFICGECIAQEFEIARGEVIVEPPPPKAKKTPRR